MYADDTIVYYADKKVNDIGKTLTTEFENIGDYLDKSELITNLKRGKTESMLLGTSKRLSC